MALERLSGRLEAVSEKIASAAAVQNVSEQISRSIPLLHGALQSMDKMGLGQSMEQFQKIFEDLDVKTADMGQSLEDVYQGSLDQGAVDNLVKQVADEHNLELGKEMGEPGEGKIEVKKKEEKNDIDSLEARLNNLKQL